MDPQAALERLRDLLNADDFEDMDREEMFIAMNEAIDVFDGLDNWMCSGGFLPTDWSRHR